MKLTPLGNRVTLRIPPVPERIGALWVPPEAAVDNFGVCQAEIVAVGQGVQDVRLQPGLRVLTRRFGGLAHDSDRQLWTVYERDVVAIVNTEGP